MGSGKSTIGKVLAETLDLPFHDLDTYIEEKENQSVADIFETKGEIYFRNLEHTSLKGLLSKQEDIVLSLGGGTPCYAGNMDLLLNNGISVYLQYPLKVLVDRLWDAKEQRPLVAHLGSKELLEDFVRKHLFERAPYYFKATHNIKLESETPEAVVQGIQKLLQ